MHDVGALGARGERNGTHLGRCLRCFVTHSTSALRQRLHGRVS